LLPVYPRTIRCQQWNDTFGMVVTNIGFDEKLVEKVPIANNERFVDPCHIVQLNLPVIKVVHYSTCFSTFFQSTMVLYSS